MGLIISSFSNNGVSYENAYAKVGSITYDNDSKIASFNVAVYAAKGDDSPIKTIRGLCVEITADSDMTTQCYAHLTTYVASIAASVTAQTEAIEAETDINTKYKLTRALSVYKKSNAALLYFADASSDEETES